MTIHKLSAEEVAIKIRDDLDYLAAVLLEADVATSPFPEFYKTVWAFILQNIHELDTKTIFRFALGLPRGHAKTTFIKLLVCYLIIHDYDIDFIQVVCATEPLSHNFLSDVHNMLQAPIITQLYGSWNNALTRSTREVKQARWHGRQITLVAIGAGTSTRGLNLDNKRPQLIICDDAQTKENDASETERNALLQWLVGTLFKSLTKNRRRALIYVGNMYSEDCILNVFAKMSQWLSLITGGILADGSALWEDIQSVEEMLDEYEHDASLGHGHIWFAEVQNDPIGSSAGILDLGESVASPPTEDYLDLDLYPIRFITVDPAGNKPTSDDNVIGVHCIQEEQKAGTIHIRNDKWSPGQVVDNIIDCILRWNVGIVFIESTAYQGSLAYWLYKALEANSLEYVKVIALPTGRASKYKRIKAWVKQLVSNKWEIMERRAYNKIIFQLYKYKTNKIDNTDDILDVCAQAVLAINKHGDEIYNSVLEEKPEEDKMPPILVQDTTRLSLLRRSHL